MFDKLMQFSLNNRLMVLFLAAMVTLSGLFIAQKLPIDVFPDLTAPTVTIMTEAHGMAPEEVELMVTFPLETAVNGAAGVRRVRSNSIQGFSTVWVEFDWGMDIYRARQIVNEKLQSLKNVFPEGVEQPILAPITSIMGEIMVVGLTSDVASKMELRSLADYNIRRRLLATPGVAEVKVYGGEVKQYQIQIDPYRLRKYDLSLTEIIEAANNTNINASGGFFTASGQEYIIRGIGRITDIRDLEYSVVSLRNNIPILLRDVADVRLDAATRLGSASINEKDAVLVVISKQPEANTIELTAELETVLLDIESRLPEGVILHGDVFKQSDFINLAINNVMEALIIGAVLVIIVLMVFLQNLRITVISILAIPLSLICAILLFRLLNLSINTMTLGGMAIAIGVLVDDAVIYVENVYRRLRENFARPSAEQKSFTDVISRASSEIRTPITIATFIIVIVFIPLFFLSGLEGRMLRPLGVAYIISVFASLFVAITITPALSSIFLRKNIRKKSVESWLITRLNKIYLPVLRWSLSRQKTVFAAVFALFIFALALYPFLGKSFLPEFNEGTFNISLATVPGTALEESDRIGRMAEKLLLIHPAVTSVARRTGRTELDEHSLGSHAHELEVKYDLGDLSKLELMSGLREKLALAPGSVFNIGQPISHRIDHMLSGTRASIAIKLFGSNLAQLRKTATQIKNLVDGVEGCVDVAVDQQIEIPQVRIKANRQKLALYGLTVADLDRLIDAAFLGMKTSEVYEGQNQYDLVLRYAEIYRSDLKAIGQSLIDTPTGARIPLSLAADIELFTGPNYISRENVQRKIVIQTNVAERDILSVVNEIRDKIGAEIQLSEDMFIDYGGQFESASEAERIILLLSLVSIAAIFALLFAEFRRVRQVVLVMINLPLALIGGLISVFFTDGVISIASLVGFVTLFGITVRNGVMMVSHFNHLIDDEKMESGAAIELGALQRLNPILMTALTTGLALLPIALTGDRPGNEIQAPLAIVVFGGLFTATLLNLIVLPVFFKRWGLKKA